MQGAPGSLPAQPTGGQTGGADRRLGDYLLEERIGEGGMGLVFVARRLSDNKQVALKVLSPASDTDPEAVTRFRREAQFMLQLDHPHIVKAFEIGTVDNQHFLSMEYVPGENLKDRIRREGKVDPVVALRMMRQIADALDYGARRKVVHRDLKPENILIRADGVAKLADMGLAILANREDLRLTAPGFTLGTPHYMSPEQIRAQRDVDTRTDIYSLGSTFYHAICGRPPFDGPNPIIIVNQHLTNEPVPPTKLVPGLAGKVEAIILKCMQKDRENRYQDCAELVAAIDEVIAPPPPPAVTPAPAVPAESPAPAPPPAEGQAPSNVRPAPTGVAERPARKRTSSRRFEEAPAARGSPAGAAATDPRATRPVPPPAAATAGLPSGANAPGPPVPVPVAADRPPSTRAAGSGPSGATAGAPPVARPVAPAAVTAGLPSGANAPGPPAPVPQRPVAPPEPAGKGGFLLVKVLVVLVLVVALALCGVVASMIVSGKLRVDLPTHRARRHAAQYCHGESSPTPGRPI
ncbi:MAG: serine/threonine-protein kinase [Planctomycetota bacterium]|jgi:hypothetical protein